MALLTFIFAAIGAVTITVFVVKGIRQFRKDLKSKPTPWLGLPWGPG
jgi:hypothetical protein